MGDEIMYDTANTQTQTQNSQVELSQTNTPSAIPIIWGRLYSGNYWKKYGLEKPDYYDLIQPDFTLGRALSCNIVVKKETVEERILKSVSKQHFVIRRDMTEPLNPAVLTDLSHNGTYVNGVQIGKNMSRVLDDNDVIAITHKSVAVFLFKDLLKNKQDNIPRKITQKYYISRVLGQGACGVVKLVYNKVTCTKYAMKIIKKCRLTNGQMNHLNDPMKIMNEVKILKALKHPFIIATEEVIDSKDAVYIILELMQGGELFDRITKQGHLSERLTRFFFKQIVLAVKYLHSQGITHRDLKPENVLLESKKDETLVKITDFGLSKFVGEDSFMKTMCGTPIYLAPEVLRANGQNCYGPEVDVWSLGVIFFVCLVGYLPFSADYREMSLGEQIATGRYRHSVAHWRGVSAPARLLMRRMLTVPVQRRITLDEILQHPWMQDDEVNLRIDILLSQTQMKHGYLSVSSKSDEENNNSSQNKENVVRLVAANKRALSDSYNSCEPIPKKLRCDEDTSSTNSFCSEE
ncbi:unnamed protein product [Colias eurytheme]|nr:unnamed protein product [Colias eurytheme]